VGLNTQQEKICELVSTIEGRTLPRPAEMCLDHRRELLQIGQDGDFDLIEMLGIEP